MKKIAGLFFDVDQTLYDGSIHRIPESAVKGINLAQKKGIKVFIATGRPYCNLLSSPLFGEIQWDGFLCSNGATFYDGNGKLLHSIAMSKEQVDGLFAFANKYHAALSLQSPDDMVSVIKYETYMEDAFGFFTNPVPHFHPYNNEEINMAMIFQKDDFDYTSENEIAGLEGVKGKSNYADVIMKGVSKGSGLSVMKDLFRLGGKLMAFGDADNDIEMIRMADLGVAMGNATELIKKNADYITSSILEDGIYNALQYFDLI